MVATILNANNITVTNVKLTGQNTAEEFTLVQFDISWENSWRTSSGPNNWDAAWVFVKYRITVANGGDGLWKHTWLNDIGHTAPGGSTINIGLLTPGTAFNTTVNPGLGAFIYRSSDGAGTNTFTNVKLRWNYGVNYKTGTTPIGDNDVVDIQVFAIEMVFVSTGTFELGSGGTETQPFYKYPTTTNTYPVYSEAEITVGTTAGNLYYAANNEYSYGGDQAGPIPADFPKGYNAFYCMKYEISQQEYVDFLNSLTQAQANTRKYDKPIDNFRYEIGGSEVGSYTTTNPYVACNWLSWADVAAYLDWSGLRPMTELEFEKACRGTMSAIANQYAWGSTDITAVTGISNGGASNETANNSGANACYGNNGTGGPMRVGTFATASSTREQAGATYYGIMEMSGNLWEYSVTVGNPTGRTYTGTHGDGTLDALGDADAYTWPGTDADGAGSRGADWWDDAPFLQSSDRVFSAYTDINRYENTGGRGVRLAP
jgi:hypothetical protein